MVTTSCFCTRSSALPRRCNSKEWSCNQPCLKPFNDCSHKCQENCHPGSCLPCSISILSSCNCGAEAVQKKCNESSWNCAKPCKKTFPCKVHVCAGSCHRPGDCGDCPFASNRTCPCGKKKYNISCHEQAPPTCGDTCNKILNCGRHKCNQRCHADQCGQCLEVVTKSCRCGSFTKELACAKEFHCTKKCTQMRLCGRHPCNKKCCDCLTTQTFNACEKTCDISLNCRKHKCQAPCHPGPCYPCPRTIVIQCRCGGSKIEVPCGLRKRVKPPHCKRLCKIPPVCHHPKRESHKCHQGECPPCRKTCDLQHKKCGHTCPIVCHTKIWVKVTINGVVGAPKGPWDTPKEVMKQKTLPCPPCEVSVMVTCIGGHETKPWPCYKAIPTSCERPCGQLLRCGNHLCEAKCHDGGTDRCTDCELPCKLQRPTGCTHMCENICHPAPCKPCRQIVRLGCHCGINSVYKRCFEITKANIAETDEMLKCGNQCPRNYKCGHRCVDNCHSGECRDGTKACAKRVKVNCKCLRLKKSFACVEVQKGGIVVDCDEECKKLLAEKVRSREIEVMRKLREEEIRNQREIEKFERKFKPKKKVKDKFENIQDIKGGHTNFWVKVFGGGIVCSLIVLITFYITDTV